MRKVQPQLEVLAYPHETSEKYVRRPFSIADDFARVFTDWGDTSGSLRANQNPNVTNQPMMTGYGSPTFGDNLDFITFNKDGTVSNGLTSGGDDSEGNISGLIVRPSIIPFDSSVSGDTRGAPLGTTGNTLSFDHFGTVETVKPLEGDLKTYIASTDMDMVSVSILKDIQYFNGQLGSILTPNKLPKNQGMQFDLLLRGYIGDLSKKKEDIINPALVVGISADWYVIYERGAYPRVCRSSKFLSDNLDKNNPEEETSGTGDQTVVAKSKEDRAYINQRTYREAPKSQFENDKILLSVYTINGYLVVQQTTNGIEANPIYIREYDKNTNINQNARTINIDYDPMPMVISFFCKYRCCLNLISHRGGDNIEWEPGMPHIPITQTIADSNTVSRDVRINSGVTGLASEHEEGYILGWIDDGTAAPCEIILPNEADQRPKVHYKCELVPSVDGANTPFVKKILYRNPGIMVKVDNVPLDITPAIRTAKESVGEIPATNGAEWTFEINRDALNNINRNVNGQPIGHWSQYVKPYSPLSAKVRWLYLADNIITGSRYEYGDWSGRFLGYMMGMSKSNNGFAEWMMNLTCYDPYIRLTKPHSIIDYRYYDLNLLYAAKNGQSLYGSECVKEILRIALGNEWADALQVYYEAGHYPLLPGLDASGNNLLPGIAGQGRPMDNTDFLVPPYGDSDPLEFIHRFGDVDYSVFGFGKPRGTGFVRDNVEWPAPFYGQYYEIMKDAPTWNVYDAVYEPDDVNSMMQSANTNFLHEHDYNHFLVLGEVQGQNQRLPWSEPIMGESRLPASDSKAEENTWRRTFFKKSAVFRYPGWAQRYADLMMLMFREVTMERVNMTFRGEENMWWGHKIWPRMTADDYDYSDIGLNINRYGSEGTDPPADPFVVVDGQGQYHPSGSKPYRVISLENSYNLEKNDTSAFQTTAQCFPINSVEK